MYGFMINMVFRRLGVHECWVERIYAEKLDIVSMYIHLAIFSSHALSLFSTACLLDLPNDRHNNTF